MAAYIFHFLYLVLIGILLFLVWRLRRSNAGLLENVATAQRLLVRKDMVERENSQLKNTVQYLKDKAFTDELTGFPNRLAFENARRQMLALLPDEHSASGEAHRRSGLSSLGLLFIDLDDFKHINDTAGHDTGDEALVKAMTAIKRALREDDTVFRLAGDEIVVLLPGISEKRIKSIVEAIYESVDMITLEQSDLKVRVSVGYSCAHTRHEGEGLLKRADQAMYQEKKQKKVNKVQ